MRHKTTDLSKQKARELSLLLGVIVFALLYWFSWRDGTGNTGNFSDSQQDEPQIIIQENPTSATQNVLIFGDLFLGRNVQVWSEQSELGYAYPFSKMDTFNPENFDGLIANLECPITDNDTSFEVQRNQLKFNCKPAFLLEAKKYFDAFSLSNNHTDNQGGEAGLIETREQLEDVGFQYFGHYDNRVTDDTCEIITLPATLVYPDETTEAVQFPTVWCGFHGVFRVPSDAEIAVMEEYAELLPTFAMPHAGAEYRAAHDALRQNLYRKMIDHGADAVVGGHPHWVQDVELYRDKLIVYSLGNFIFDQRFEPDVQRGIGVGVHLRFEYDDNFSAWIQLADQCLMHKDSCLKEAATLGLHKPDYEITHTLEAVAIEDGVASQGDQALLDALYERTGWLKLYPE